MNNFGILHPYKWFKSPLRDYKKCLPNITFQSKYHLRNRATQGRLYFSPIGTGNMQMGCLYADFTRLCGSVTPLPPSDHGPDNDIIYDVGRIFWTKIYMFGYVKTFIMVNIDKTLYFICFNWLKININYTKHDVLIAITVITIVMGLQ